MNNIKAAMLKCADKNLNGLASSLNETQLRKFLSFFLDGFTTEELRRLWARDQKQKRGLELSVLYEITFDLYREDMISDILK
tara:strand:- start:1092 stop:1337 length:246 start_codon:yes stop_codon:yes gene_type:complete